MANSTPCSAPLSIRPAATRCWLLKNGLGGGGGAGIGPHGPPPPPRTAIVAGVLPLPVPFTSSSKMFTAETVRPRSRSRIAR